MMIIRNSFAFQWLAFLLLWVYSCSPSSSTEYIFEENNIIDVNIFPGKNQGGFSLDSIVESVDYLQLNLGTQFSIKIPYKLIYFNSSFLIYDLGNQDVFLFDKDGNLINKLGGKGRGPGEFLAITDVEYNPYSQTIDLLCSVKRTILKFDAGTGDFLSELNLGSTELIPPGILRFIPLNKQQFLFSGSTFYPDSDESFNYHFFIFDYKSKKMLKKWLPFKEYEKRITESVYPPKIAFYRTNNDITGQYWNSRIIYKFSNDRFTPKYQFNFGEEHAFINDILEPTEFDRVYKENGVCCLDPLFDMDNFIFGSYRYQNYHGESFLYSKKTNRLTQYKSNKVINPFNAYKFRLPIGATKDELIFSISPDQLINSFKNNQATLIPKEKKKLEDFINKINPNGGLILLFYKLKNSF